MTDVTDHDLLSRIATNPKVMLGKPVIRGTRLTVELVLEMLGHGATVEDVLAEYPGLAQEDVRACALYASRSLASIADLPLSAEAA